MSVRHVVLIAGPQCSGKSTLATNLAAERPGIVLDLDVIARGLGSTRGWLHDEPVMARAEAIYQGELGRIVAAHDVVAYVVRSAPAARARADLAARLRADVVYVLDPGMGECLRRATVDGRPAGTHAGIRQWYRRYAATGVDRRPSEPRLVTSREW
ncbi:ATP-binding protein [Amycolatopsis roodepoortensis]|uniref:ATP-binding protein n=1 Tax=Amycolatopsis roodepoortensis TaxID=700274 RepID=UPI00214CDBBE|nr:ATP-binding protein [Amycolatopsis roodepoortensis]UUV34392.1 ATP-binding protein [Amycolatopsis roodepoortensis]